MYLTHKNLRDYIVFDIETDSLKPTRIWCAVARNVATNQVWELRGHDEIRRFIEEAPATTVWVGHNAISFDFPNCNRLLGTRVPVRSIVDTLVLSYLYHPNIESAHPIKERRGHSLGAWALRLNLPVQKDEFNDFSRFSEQLLARCVADTAINRSLFIRLSERMRLIGYSEESCEVEHLVRHIIDKQERNGWYFDIPGAETLLGQFRQSQLDLTESISRLFPSTLAPVKTYPYKTTKGGSPYQSYLRHVAAYPKLTHDGGTYTVWDWNEFNLNSPKQRIEKLLQLGWVPERFTKKGSPQVDEESLVAAAQTLQTPELQAMADWLVLEGRARKCEEMLKFVNRGDHRMHGHLITCGAMSRRMTHVDPNTSNIPANDAKYGRELRALWQATPGLVLCGNDAKSLQMRIFGHYIEDKEVAKQYIEGDPHTANAIAIGDGETRRNAKNHFYAVIFGAYPPKLGKMVGKSPVFGEHVLRTLYDRTPGLEQATEQCKAEFRQRGGRLKCLDGGFVNVPAENSAFNYLIQPGEVCVMKRASILLEERVKKAGIWSRKVGDNHDEFQHEVKPGDADAFNTVARSCIRDAGEHFNLTIPLEGDSKIGQSWAETH